MTHEWRAGFRLQLWQFRASLGSLSILVAAPFYVLIFFSVIRHSGRPDLDMHTALAPCLASMWTLALSLSGAISEQDKRFGTTEPLLATPAASFRVLLGRTTAIGLLSLVCAVETFAVAVVAFGVRLDIAHPLLFAVAMAATCAATTGTVTVMAVLFMLGRSAGAFQNSLSYPVYLLGGVFVPVTLLPDWLRPFSDAVFLSWSADLLRDAIGTPDPRAPWSRLAVVLVLGGFGLLAGRLLQVHVLRRLRQTGEVGW